VDRVRWTAPPGPSQERKPLPQSSTCTCTRKTLYFTIIIYVYVCVSLIQNTYISINKKNEIASRKPEFNRQCFLKDVLTPVQLGKGAWGL
jgi:hypothetical protein